MKARDGIEAQRGLNDVFPGDEYSEAPAADAEVVERAWVIVRDPFTGEVFVSRLAENLEIGFARDADSDPQFTAISAMRPAPETLPRSTVVPVEQPSALRSERPAGAEQALRDALKEARSFILRSSGITEYAVAQIDRALTLPAAEGGVK